MGPSPLSSAMASGASPLTPHFPTLGKKIQERTHPRREQSTLTRVDRMEGLAITGVELLQNGYETPGIDVVLDREPGKAYKPDTAKCQTAQRFAVARLNPPE